MGKVNGSGKCWDKYSGDDDNMDWDEINNFLDKEYYNRSDFKNISYQEAAEIDSLVVRYWSSDGINIFEFDAIVNLTNRHLASGEGGGSGGGGGSSGGGSSGGGGGGNNAEQMKHKIRNTKEYHRLDRGEKNRVLQEMDKRASGGISQSEYIDVFNKYVLPYD